MVEVLIRSDHISNLSWDEEH